MIRMLTSLAFSQIDVVYSVDNSELGGESTSVQHVLGFEAG